MAEGEALLRMRQSIDRAELVERIRRKRDACGLSIRQAAAQAGVSASTFARVVNEKHLPDYERLVLLAQWVGIALEQLPVTSDGPDTEQTDHTIVHSPKETTLESIAVHLRADDAIDSEDVDLLMNILRAAYGDLRKRHMRAAM
jgi:transcriptional regulator with XRE-family HTH domain